MSLNLFNEELNRAYKNTGLLASDVWNYKKDDTEFQKANLHLWVRFNEIEKRLEDEESEDELSTSTEEVYRTVRDTIPLSRLASYGDYVYNEKRENMFVTDDGSAQDKHAHACSNSNQIDLEVWMLPEVEDQFKKLSDVSSSRWTMFTPGERHIDPEPPADPANRVTKTNPCQWLSKNTWPDQLISHYPNLPCALQENKRVSLFNEDTSIPSYSEAELEEKLEEFPCPRYLIRTNEDLELHMRIISDSIRSLWDDQDCSYGGFCSRYSLNADVPEFLPSAFSVFVDEDQQQDSTTYAPSLQLYPSIYDTSYEAELFPYSNPSIIHDAHAQSDFLTHSVDPEEEKLIYNMPVFVGPPASYFNLDYKEEIPNNYVQLPVSDNLPTFNVRKPQEVLDYLEKQLSKIYNPRVDDLKNIYNASGKIGKTFQNVQQNYFLIQETPPSREQRPSQKPLYSDVLMNDAGSLCYNDSRYDELEKEAVEQYSGSDAALLGNLSVPFSPNHDLTHEATAQNNIVCSETESVSPEPSQPNNRKSRRRVRLADFSPRRARFTSQTSHSSKYSKSPTLGSKRSSNISSLCRDSCIPNKQALWMEKKKRKLEKKRKLSKRNKIQCNEQPVEFVENEIILIGTFLELSNKFSKHFFEKDWKAVVAQLETNAFRSFEVCLKMISDCLQWLHWFLAMSKDLKKDLVSNKKRLELTNNILEVLSDLFNVLQQYIYSCSKIKTVVPFDHRLYFDSDRRLRFPLAACDQVIDKCVDKKTYFTRMFSFDALLSGKPSQRLDVAIDREFMNRSEWKLKLNYGGLWKNRDTCVRLINHERVFDLVLDRLNEQADSNTSHKMLKVVDDFLIWSEWQWKFLDGWMFSSDYIYYNFNWLNKFNVTSLEYFTSFARMIFFLKNCILYSTEAVFSNKHCSPKCQLLWSVDGFDPINTKTASLSILLQEGKGWYFGVMWISKEPCNPWQPFCENSCCIGWDSSDIRNTGTGQESSSLQKAFQGKTARSHVSKQKRDEVKIKRYTGTANSKTLSRPLANRQPVLNKIIDGKTNLPEEKQQSLCILQ